MTRKIYISPSTQEKNIGFGDYGTEEFRMNQIANKLEELLIKNGYEVYRNSPEMTVQDIVDDSNKVMPDIHIALHSNASINGEAMGIEIFASRENSSSDKLARLIYDELQNIYYDKDFGRGIKYTNELKEVREVLAPVVLIEMGFHDNPQDSKWILDNEDNIANAIFSAIEKYFE